jgi:general secretion pathway protein D|tara:strand:- start:21913 stop:24495 length:2583 start_codon:yes stop_codon:yes gene_type:complete
MENTPTHRSSRTAAILMAAALAMPIVVSSTASAQENSLVNKEIARRELQIAEADKAVLVGRKAYEDENYEEAVSQYRKAVIMLPQGPIAADRRSEYIGHLLDGSVALSQQFRKTGKYTEARELLDNVLEKDPGNVVAKKHLEYLDDPIRTSPTLTYSHVKNVEKVRKLLYRANSYYDQAKFDHAVLEFKEVLRIDPHNKAARRGMEKVSSAKSDYYRAAYDQTRASMLTQVDQAWEISVPPAIQEGQGIGTNLNTTVSPALYLRQKLQSIMLPLVEFENDATVRDAIRFLRQRSRELDTEELDPTKKGLNFVFRNPTIVDGGEGMGEGDGIADEIDKIENINLGGLTIRNIPMEEALRQICQKSGLRYKVENYSVVILKATDVDDNEMYARTFRVPPDLRNLISDGPGGGGGGAADDPFGEENTGDAGNKKSIAELLELQGIKFPEGATAGFSKARSTLTVRNTANALDQVETLVDELSLRKPRQIKMLTKFVEISQENTDELGFDWIISPFGITSNSSFLSGGTLGNSSGRNASDFVSPVAGVSVPGIPSAANESVSNIVTGGNRSGDYAISRDSIDSFLNNPNRTAQNSSVAPGILSLTGLFTDGQVQMIMRGLAQKKGADVMTAPSIVSRSGERATIEIIREFIYPTEYEPPELPQSVGVGGGIDGGAGGAAGGNIFPVTPATPTAFETRNTGVTLEVEPILGEDGYTIDLTFKPEIVEFEGFINYGSPIQSPGTDALGNPITITITENRIEMPVFSTRRVNTSLTIYDGHTVAVGGLMRENVQNVEDKVPILGDLPLIGRLFQTKAENHIKSNLIIFVTARIIDATGQPVSQTIVGVGGVPVEAGVREGLLPAIAE